MDPLSIAASVAGLLSLCIQIGQTVGTLADALENVDNTISSFRGEISALSGVLKSISTAFSDPKRHRILEEASHGTGHLGQYWQGVVVSLDHCGATLKKMNVVLDGIQTSRRTRIFRSFGKHLKLTSEEGILTLYRQEVQSHCANLQISLQMISVCLSLASDDMNADTSVRLDELSDDVRNIFRLLDRMKNDLPTPKPGDSVTFALVSSSQTVVEDLQSCLGAAEVLISDASTLAEKQSVRESTIAPPNYFTTAQRRRVQEWINAPTIAPTVDNGESSSEATTRTVPSDNKSTISTTTTTPPVERFKPELAAHNEEEEVRLNDEDSCSESSDIDGGFQINLFQAGLQYFEQQDYASAERFFTKAVQTGEGEKSKPSDGNMIKIKFYLAQTLCKQQRWDDAHSLLISLQTLTPTEDSLKWMESSILHELALVYLGKGFTDKARVCAKSASEKRKKMHGKKDARFRSSVGLLADICHSQGDPEAAEGYRRFIPQESWYLYTRIHRNIPECNIDEKEVVAVRKPLMDTEMDDYFGEPGPLNAISRSNSSQLPNSNAVSRSTSFASRTATTPLTQYSFDPIPPKPLPIPFATIDSYVPPRIDAFELDSNTIFQGPLMPDKASIPSEDQKYLKGFLKAFREVGQNQMLGSKEKAAKIAMAYYRSFETKSLKFKHITRYMNDTAWKALENNILEGLSSLASTGHGFSAIHFFAMLGIPSIVALLLDRRADISAKAEQIHSYTQAPTETRRGKLGGLARSFSRGALSTSTAILPVECNWSPLHFACAYSGEPETVKLLIDRGAQLEEKVGKGYTPLLVATRKAALDTDKFLNHTTDLAVVKILVDCGAKVDVLDEDGLGIHAHAHFMGSEDLAAYLLSLSAD
ncbi:uncharacterized protein DFL_007506 [Arthrobotrys flagrans]|uniref:Uncharacterized protein n=1 Tax=Arthrobotrys flagrans TaxID=97331 RepID=A0A436ZWF8_ARTFL|nr:hypothetical protein DFL_007506 [Arthrobotrys flagrans]